MLESTTDNWETIVAVFDRYEVTSVVVKMTNTVFDMMISSRYQTLANALLTNISAVPNIFLTHESLISGEDSFDEEQRSEKLSDIDTEIEEEYDYMYSYYDQFFTPPKKSTREAVINLFKQFDIDLIPYKKNVELGLLATSFLDQNENHLIFRLYVPSERMWAHEAEKLLKLFREYLHKVSSFDVRQEQYSTNQGVVHEFYASHQVDRAEIPREFEEFTQFMNTCVSNPNNAQAILESKNMDSREIVKIVERYSKEARRLHIDLKQERELKSLTIRHRLESELGEYVRSDEDWNAISILVDSVIPKIDGVNTALTVDRKSFSPSQNFTININPQIVETVNGIVAQEILGDQHLGTDAKELLDLIEKYGSTKKSELASAVHELSDESAQAEDRINARQKLKGFIYSLGAKGGDIAAGILQTFIEGQVGL
ncbi:conserved hypothetical protein [Vibrio crassostreae]|nr:conserved hypothetical protein [Vibrio crassostreae]CAK3526870.1 conserved hypothetical protein [Vibrio crassostreae]